MNAWVRGRGRGRHRCCVVRQILFLIIRPPEVDSMDRRSPLSSSHFLTLRAGLKLNLAKTLRA